MKDISNADARLSIAVDVLATSPRTLKERLVDAAIGVINNIKSEDLPRGDLRSEFESLEALLTRMPPQLLNDGSIQATVRAMTDAEAEETARRLAALARDVAEEHTARDLESARRK